MYKEAAICVITIIGIVLLNILTGNYTKDSVTELTNNLMELKEEITEENISEDYIENKVNYIFDRWNKINNVLAFYLEHNELEKVENNIVSLKSAIYTKDYSEAINELDESVFVLQHIQEKNSFHFKNIF